MCFACMWDDILHLQVSSRAKKKGKKETLSTISGSYARENWVPLTKYIHLQEYMGPFFLLGQVH